MEFDWIDPSFDLSPVLPREIEESFEDPFSVRILPERYGSGEARYFNLGYTTAARPIFSVFWTDGKRYRVIFAREMTKEEDTFYQSENEVLA